MKPKHKRLVTIIIFMTCIFAGATIIFKNFSENLIYYRSPAELHNLKLNKPNKFTALIQNKIRVGGLVKKGSLKEVEAGAYNFIVSDKSHEIKIEYQGILPPIFREGQGVVAEGAIQNEENDNIIRFTAEKLVTKHDENYMPPEVKRSLDK